MNSEDNGDGLQDFMRGERDNAIAVIELEMEAEKLYVRGHRSAQKIASEMEIPVSDAHQLVQNIESRFAFGLTAETRSAQVSLALEREEAVLRECWKVIDDDMTTNGLKVKYLAMAEKCNTTIIKLLGLSQSESRNRYYFGLMMTFVGELQSMAENITDPVMAQKIAGMLRQYVKEGHLATNASEKASNEIVVRRSSS